MNGLSEILKITLPSLIMLVMIWYLVKKYFEQEEQKRRVQRILKNQELITPLKLQACERIILLLERISPENLLLRINRPSFNCKQLQTELINAVRAEYEHNISQQLYVSVNGWEMVKMAKNNLIHLINTSAERLKPEDPSASLNIAIMEAVSRMPKNYTSEAIIQIKEELTLLTG
ncbi:MAG: hypothetical protein R6W78_18965 [Bacteroidales bacterium]